jgi:hypothetical protein
MLPERAFQPRSPYGMTLEGGGGGIIGAIGDVFQGAVDVVKDVGSFIDDKVIQPIVKDPISAVATVVGATIGGAPGAGIANTIAGLVQGESPKEAVQGGLQTAGTMFLIGSPGGSPFGGTESAAGTEGFGQFSDSVYQGASGTVPSAPVSSAAVPSAFDTAVNTAIGTTPELGSFGQTGTSGFGTALPPASEVSAGLTAGGFAPGTAANLAGETAAGVGATNLLGGATATNPLIPSPSLSISDALRGARLINSLLTQQQPQIPQENLPTTPRGAIDYSTLLGLLSQRAGGTGLLGTQFQPRPINLSSLLG